MTCCLSQGSKNGTYALLGNIGTLLSYASRRSAPGGSHLGAGIAYAQVLGHTHFLPISCAYILTKACQGVEMSWYAYIYIWYIYTRTSSLYIYIHLGLCIYIYKHNIDLLPKGLSIPHSTAAIKRQTDKSCSRATVNTLRTWHLWV